VRPGWSTTLALRCCDTWSRSDPSCWTPTGRHAVLLDSGVGARGRGLADDADRAARHRWQRGRVLRALSTPQTQAADHHRHTTGRSTRGAAGLWQQCQYITSTLTNPFSPAFTLHSCISHPHRITVEHD